MLTQTHHHKMNIQKLVVWLYGDRKLSEMESKVLVTNNCKKFICVNQVNLCLLK